MAAKYMKTVRIVIPFITLVILTSQLLGHAALSKNEMLEELQQSEEVVLEYVEPRTTLSINTTTNPSNTDYSYSTNTYVSEATPKEVKENIESDEIAATEAAAPIDLEEIGTTEEMTTSDNINTTEEPEIEAEAQTQPAAQSQAQPQVTITYTEVPVEKTPAAPEEVNVGLIEAESPFISETSD